MPKAKPTTEAPDGSEPLENRRWEAFALLVAAKDFSAAGAYRKCWPKSSPASSETDGPKLARNSQVKLRIAYLRAKATEKLKEKAGAVVLSIAEKRAFLARVVRTSAGRVRRNSRLVQEWSETMSEGGTTTKVRIPDKLAAIKLDNDLAAEGAEAGANKAIEVLIRRL